MNRIKIDRASQQDLDGMTETLPEQRFNNSVYKSGIQKAVRRNEPMKAMRLAKSHITLFPADFLRRIMIIAPEDSMLHPYYGLVGEMLKTRSKALTKSDKDKLLNLVYQVADCNYRDWFDHNPDDDEYVGLKSIRELAEPERKFMEALMYRANAGGMVFDQGMMQKYVRIWANRFVNKGWTVDGLWRYFNKTSYEWDDVEFGTSHDLLWVSIDWHSFPPIERLMKNKGVFDDIIERSEPILKDLGEWKDDGYACWLPAWIEEMSKSGKIDITRNEPIDRYHLPGEKDLSELKPIYRQYMPPVVEEWKSISDWFIRKQLERCYNK